MNGPDFLDTNVLVYAYDSSDRRKQKIAQELVRRALAGDLLMSAQVLAEFVTTLVHKKTPPARPEDVTAVIDALAPVRLIHPDREMVRRAVEANSKYGLHFYDGMIVAAAERASCDRIFSEDFNAGQEYFGVRAENPFSRAGTIERNRRS